MASDDIVIRREIGLCTQWSKLQNGVCKTVDHPSDLRPIVELIAEMERNGRSNYRTVVHWVHCIDYVVSLYSSYGSPVCVRTTMNFVESYS